MTVFGVFSHTEERATGACQRIKLMFMMLAVPEARHCPGVATKSDEVKDAGGRIISGWGT